MINRKVVVTSGKYTDCTGTVKLKGELMDYSTDKSTPVWIILLDNPTQLIKLYENEFTVRKPQ